MSALTFTPGKFYKTRDGRKARVYATDGDTCYPIHGAYDYKGEWFSDSWLSDGRNNEDIEGGELDLIAEWVDAPEVDWSKMPAWANWVAMDEDRVWFFFGAEPEMRCEHWTAAITDDADCAEIPQAYCPKWSGDWRDSLVTRPTEGAK